MFAVVISRTSQINLKSHHSRVMNKLFKHAFDPFHGKYFAVSFSRETLFLKKFSFAQSSLPLSPSSCDNWISSSSNYMTLVTSKNNPFGTGFHSTNSVAPIRKNPTMFSATRPFSRILPCLRGSSSGQDRLHIQQRADERNKTREEGC